MRRGSVALLIASFLWVAGLATSGGFYSAPGNGGSGHGGPAPMMPFGDDGGGSH